MKNVKTQQNKLVKQKGGRRTICNNGIFCATKRSTPLNLFGSLKIQGIVLSFSSVEVLHLNF